MKKYTHYIIGFVLLLLLGFLIDLKPIIFLIGAVALNTVLAINLMKISIPCDFELCTLSSVIGTTLFGIKFGILVAILSKLVPSIIRGKIILDNFFQIISYVIAGIVALPFSNIVIAGIFASFIANVFMYFVSQYFLGLSPFDNLIYTGTNMMGNLVFFSVLAAPIYFIIG